MAIDQRDVSSKLRFMDDRALQQYAAMHKSDPYIFPLAFQESQNRQKLRMQQQAQAGAMPQPKVADQALAQMAPPQAQPMPEDQGIATLPAPNMKFGAEGGIMGYEGYGEEAQQFGQEPVLRMAEGGYIPRYQGNPRDGSLVRMPYGQPVANMTGEIPGFVAGTTNFQTQPSVDPDEPFLRKLFRERQETVEAQRTQEARARAAKGQPLSAEDQARIAKADTAKATADTSAQDMAQFDAASNLYMTERAAKQAAAKPAPAADNKAAPRADAGRASSAPTGIAAAAAAKDDPFSMSSIKKAQDEAMGDSKYQIGALNNQLVGIRNRAETQMQQRLDERKKEITEEGDVYKDRSDRLVERAKGLAAQKNENQGLALLNAGLAIMSTPGSLASAIGKGAQVGTAQYAAGIKDLRAAQERLDEANERISELRLNRKDLNSREIRALEKERDAAIRDGEKMVFDFAKDVYGMDRKKADATFTSYMSGQEKKAEIQSRERIAATGENRADARAAMPTGADRTAMMLGTGDTPAARLESGMRKLQEITADKSGMAAVKVLADINAKRQPGEAAVTMEDLLKGAREFSSLMYGPKVADVAPTRARP